MQLKFEAVVAQMARPVQPVRKRAEMVRAIEPRRDENGHRRGRGVEADAARYHCEEDGLFVRHKMSSGKSQRVFLPRFWVGKEINEVRIAAAAESPLDCQLDRRAEKQHMNCDGQSRAAICFVARAVVGETQVELDGNADETEHIQRAAEAQITAENRREIGGAFLSLERKI